MGRWLVRRLIKELPVRRYAGIRESLIALLRHLERRRIHYLLSGSETLMSFLRSLSLHVWLLSLCILIKITLAPVKSECIKHAFL